MNKIIFIVLALVGLSQATRQFDPRVESIFGGRVVNGTDTNIEDHPFQISIRIVLDGTERHVCGGSIINRNSILTAAHCVDWNEGFFVRAGSSIHSQGGQVVNITEILIHQRWNITTIDYDVAILKVEDLVFNEAVQPIALPYPHSDVSAGETVALTGWGLLSSNGIIPDHLQLVEKPVIDRQECIELHENFEIDDEFEPVLSERVICAGGGGFGACNGDSGGPLVYDNEVVGIVSWGIPPCGDNPTVYMRTSYFIDWIEDRLY